MRNKIFLAILATAILVLLATSFFTIQILYQNFEKSIFENLKNDLNIITNEIIYENDYEKTLQRMDFANIRITLISNDGNIIFESLSDFDYNSKELISLKDKIDRNGGFAKTVSKMLKEKFYYYAEKLNDGKILRVGIKQNTIIETFLQNGQVIVLFFLVLLFVLFLFSYILARSIVKPINSIDVEHIDLEHEEKFLSYIELKPLLKKIAEQKKQLESDKAKLEHTETIRKDFTANVSHELKTPLQAISGYAELLKSGIAQKKDILPFAEKIFTESFRMHNLVDDIISLTELESEQKKSQWHLTNFVVICKNVIDSLSMIADKKKVFVHLDYDEQENYMIFSVPEVVHTIIYNLTDNAIKYNKTGGSIFISLQMEYNYDTQTETKSKRICLKIKDTGIGIESENLPRIFERFYRVDKSRSKTVGGTGLGLSIVKHSVALLHAEISVQSQLGEGTQFIVLF